MRISIDRSQYPEEAPSDLKAWERDVPEGWRRAHVRDSKLNKWPRDTDTQFVTFVDEETGAWVERTFKIDDSRDLRALGDLAEALGFDPLDFDTDALRGDLEIHIKHGGEKRKPPYHWINVTGFRSAYRAPEAPRGDELDGMTF